jgi:preprotein translocase subunit Sss1
MEDKSEKLDQLVKAHKRLTTSIDNSNLNEFHEVLKELVKLSSKVSLEEYSEFVQIINKKPETNPWSGCGAMC